MHLLPPPETPPIEAPSFDPQEPPVDEWLPDVAPVPYTPAAHDWVPAAPFRAHLLHLVISTGMTWPTVAVASGLPLPLADHLLHERRGRRLRRIRPQSAVGLMSWTPAALDRAARTWLPSYRTGRLARHLVSQGWDPGRLAEFCRLEAATLEGLLDGYGHGCRLGVTWSMEAAGRLLELRRPSRAGAA